MKDKKKLIDNDIKKSFWINQEKVVDNLFDIKEWENYKSEKDKNTPTDKMYQRIKQEIDIDIVKYFEKRDRKYKILSLIKYSAVACLIVCFSWLIYQNLYFQDKTTNQLALDVSLPEINQTIWLTQTNQDNKNKWITLPDSSKVKLYPSSQISYPKNFATTHRSINLRGKAYFNVTKDPTRPFSVWSDYTKTTALGTSFTIKAYHNQKNTTVTLHTGKIVIKSVKGDAKFDDVYLSLKGEKLIFNSANQHLSHISPPLKTKDKPIQVIDNELVSPVANMEKMPLPEVVELLSRLYNRKIIIENKSLGHITFTGSVDSRTESLDEALQVICLINNLELHKSEDGTYHIDIK